MQCSLKAFVGLRGLAASFVLAFSVLLPAAHAQAPQAPEIAARSYLLLDIMQVRVGHVVVHYFSRPSAFMAATTAGRAATRVR